MISVYCVLREEMGGYPVEDFFYTLSKAEAEECVEDNTVDENSDCYMWYVEVEGFATVEEAEEYIKDMKKFSSAKEMKEKWGDKILEY